VQVAAASGLTLAITEAQGSALTEPDYEAHSEQAHAGLVKEVAPNLVAIRQLLAEELEKTISTRYPP